MTVQFVPLFGPIPGGIELAVIVLIAILLFGANKIPKLARSTGQAMGEFQKGREEIDQELQEMRDGATRSPSDTTDEPEPEIGTDDSTANTETSATETRSETDADLETEENR
ncbi:Sec-independent protein translocase subunit TatA/TatB [Halalkalicoccus jeotgali]|uniref:Twin-arginine translocation protein, TatA/E family subunit n=1 Tax=Halalkalicoccus jeotgali (strain DSM 18796 / CECT 7217 / JCM 14584 / KCTC 4019 / B3) TaxID=795797 RepID=D8J4V4_HALJB|nr:twin-arginine translocase TatA/TatE family subunit [Halalkalicoccus jeotgali]ADJ15571.1 twin-arginine translocation protein, TatA/E family subunit [Halalkalicoccus jeotgali B3]ELY36021.1 twin-arginine translocation protein, TatA/E family subunit [Halalkalicoccus jeotgali B3]